MEQGAEVEREDKEPEFLKKMEDAVDQQQRKLDAIRQRDEAARMAKASKVLGLDEGKAVSEEELLKRGLRSPAQLEAELEAAQAYL